MGLLAPAKRGTQSIGKKRRSRDGAEMINAKAAEASAPQEVPASALACLVIIGRHHGLHLSVSQLIHDNVLAPQEVSLPDLLKCAATAGLKAKLVDLTRSGRVPLEEVLRDSAQPY